MKIINKIQDYYIIFCIYAFIGWLYEVLWMRFAVPPFKWINRGVLLGPFLPIYGFGMLILWILLNKIKVKKHTLKSILYLIMSTIVITTFIFITIIEYTTPKIYHLDIFFQKYGIILIICNLTLVGISYLIIKYNKKLMNTDVTWILIFLLIWIITTLIEYVSHYMIETYSNKLLWDYTNDFLNINRRVNWDASRNFAIGGTFLLYYIQPIIDNFIIKNKNIIKNTISIIIGIPMILDLIFHVILKIV